MGLDVFQSRRNFNEHCRWWARTENDEIEGDELVYNRIASGDFFAREVSAEIDDDLVIGGAIMINRHSVTIYSPDYLGNIHSEDLVEYQGEIWRVKNVQKRKARMQNTDFGRTNRVSHHWYLNLIKG